MKYIISLALVIFVLGLIAVGDLFYTKGHLDGTCNTIKLLRQEFYKTTKVQRICN